MSNPEPLNNDKQYVETPCPCGRLHMVAVTKLATKRDRFEKAYHEQSYEVEQILGKALGYPWYKDDQKNFPGATEADGVCVGEHVPESLAAEAAARLTDLSAKCEGLEEVMLCSNCAERDRYAPVPEMEYVAETPVGPVWRCPRCSHGIDAARAAQSLVPGLPTQPAQRPIPRLKPLPEPFASNSLIDDCDIRKTPERDRVGAVRRALKQQAKTDGGAADLESTFASAWADRQPQPFRQYAPHPSRQWRIDFAFDPQGAKVCLEVDGMAHRIKDRFKRDVDKHNWLVMNGWTYLRCTGDMLRNDIDGVVAMVCEAMEVRNG